MKNTESTLGATESFKSWMGQAKEDRIQAKRDREMQESRVKILEDMVGSMVQNFQQERNLGNSSAGSEAGNLGKVRMVLRKIWELGKQ